MKKAAQTLREARVKKGLYQRDVGEACGYKQKIAQRTVAKWETDCAPIPRKHLRTISELLDIPIEELI